MPNIYFLETEFILSKPGKGSTSTIIDKAKNLLKWGEKVLILTANKVLANEIENHLSPIIKEQNSNNLFVTNIYNFIKNYLDENGKNIELINNEGLVEYWNQAIINSNEKISLDINFFIEEWRMITSSLSDLNLENYLKLHRSQRYIKLDKAKKIKVWHIIEEYIKILNSSNKMDIDYAIFVAKSLLKENPSFSYNSIIIAQAEKISINIYQFIREYAQTKRSNNLIIVSESNINAINITEELEENLYDYHGVTIDGAPNNKIMGPPKPAKRRPVMTMGCEECDISPKPKKAPVKKNLKDILDNIDDSFQKAMFNHIDSRGFTDVEVYKRARIDRKLFSKIRSNVNYKPSKKTAICICFALMLNLDDTLDLLGKAGFTLSNSSKSDLIVKYFIEKEEYNLDVLNMVLYEYNEPILYY